MPIQFFTEDIPFHLRNKNAIRQWIQKEWTKKQPEKKLTINYIFCSDSYLLNINKQFLAHNYYTDIITFDNSTSEKNTISDIFISIDRVIENAKTHQVSFTAELYRVLIHGVLHLSGLKDKTAAEASKMRAAEDAALKYAPF